MFIKKQHLYTPENLSKATTQQLLIEIIICTLTMSIKNVNVSSHNSF